MSESADQKKWFVLYTMPQHEKKVAAYLEKIGVENYLPLVLKKRKWSDRIKKILFPLLPGYIFTHIDWSRESLSCLQHPGAKAFVRNESGPAWMEEREIRNLRKIVEVASELETQPDKNFPPGQEVEIKYGPFKGVRGVVARVKSQDRIFVHLPLLGTMISTEIDVVDLKKLD